MNNPYEAAGTRNASRIIAVLMVAIALWGIYHAVGAGLSLAQKKKLFGVSQWWSTSASKQAAADQADKEKTPDDEQVTARDRADIRRSIVVALASFGFLAFWGVLLYSQKRKRARPGLQAASASE